MKKYHNFLIVILLSISFSIQAQDWEFGFGAGVMNYTGDVAPNYSFKNVRPAGELFFRYNPNPVFSLRIGGLLGSMRANETDADDQFQQRRAVRLLNTVYEASIRAEYNFRDYRAMSELSRVSPFIFVGGSVAHIQVNTNYQDQTAKAMEIAIPVGVGIKYLMAYNYNLGFEFGMRPTFTDALDGLTADGSGEARSSVGKFQMTNLFNNDRYYYMGISLSYTFNRVVCPLEFR